MRRLDLDFSRSVSRPTPAAWLLAALGLALLGAAAWHWAAVEAERDQARRELAAAQRSAVGAKPAKPRGPDSDAVAQAVAQLQVPWSARLLTLEQHRQPKVALLAIETDAAKGGLVITAEARDRRAMLEYFAALQQAPNLAGVTLASHEVLDDQGQNPVQFVLKGQWR